ncbi:MAG: hypothetical protein RID09_26815 [Coleofasciculus sp. G1-WW12-02]|uniref:hypothetical protein n=1 Tax=unclassified Coleofasciculus TaxID=2692782 RepID=UPI0032F79457
MLRLLAGGVPPVGAGFTDNVLAQTNNLTKPALLGEQGKIGKIGELILALDRGGFSYIWVREETITVKPAPT